MEADTKITDARSCRSQGTVPSFEEGKCIFCDKERKRVSTGFELLVKTELFGENEKAVKDMALKIGDTEMMAKLTSGMFNNRHPSYHKSCKRNYLRKTDSNSPEKSPENRDLYAAAFENLKTFLEDEVIAKERIKVFDDVYQQFLQYAKLLSEDYKLCKLTKYRPDRLVQRIICAFEGKIAITNLGKKKGTIVHAADVTAQEMAKQVSELPTSDEYILTQAAQILRAKVLNLDCTPLPFPLQVVDIGKGEVQIPEELYLFFKAMFTDRCTGERAHRLAISAASDMIYIVSRGRKKPAKQLCMGLGLKSLVNSRKIVEILNRYGHCVSYSVVEELETDLARTVQESNRATPDGLVCRSGLSTGIAWDNFDENCETLSGKDTVHDTVGICFQNTSDIKAEIKSEHRVNEPTTYTCSTRMCLYTCLFYLCICIPRTLNNALLPVEVDSRRDAEPATEMTAPGNKRSRSSRSFTPLPSELLPYAKRPKISFTFNNSSTITPPSLNDARLRDRIWMLGMVLAPGTPMWRGFNAGTTKDPLPRQTVGYMRCIPFSPTRMDVVRETLNISSQVAKECGETYFIVHYDLAIAKPALTIQAAESPLYDNLFVAFGPFHIQLAFFASLGLILEGSGASCVLTDSGVLASGSVGGFLSGKQFNRCKRLHPMLCQAFRVLHFRSFVITKFNSCVPDAAVHALRLLQNDLSPTEFQIAANQVDVQHLLDAYEVHSSETRSGKHGATAQFWLTYMELVDIYLVFERACKTNDLDLFMWALNEMLSIFFVANRHNYSRWMLKYLTNLQNIDVTHPGLGDVFRNGGLSIRRSMHAFSRSPVDLTLEQTVNKDAASRRSGMTPFLNSSGARQRWAVSRTARSGVVSLLLENAGLTSEPEGAKELRLGRIEKDTKDLNALVESVENMMNPFHTPDDSNLYCISTGRAANSDVVHDLTNLFSIGKSLRDGFRRECIANPGRFSAPIKKRKLHTFAEMGVKTKVKANDHRILELTCTRQLLGRLLVAAASSGLDMKAVVSFPMTPVPLSVANPDGTPRKTNKAKLLQALCPAMEVTPDTSADEPLTRSIYIVDGMFLVQSFSEACSTYGDFAQVYLRNVLRSRPKHCQEVHIVFDRYDLPSIKDGERIFRQSATHRHMTISGPSQRFPSDFRECLKASAFKQQLLQFLLTEWQKAPYSDFLSHLSVYVGISSQCFLLQARNKQVNVTQFQQLDCEHEEADTRIIFHISHIADNLPLQSLSNIVVRATDTDILVLLLFHASRFGCTIYLDWGTAARNNRKQINVTELQKQLGSDLCVSLPGYHAFSGCDYTAAFSRKGKLKMLEMLKQDDRILSAFGSLGLSEEVDPAIFQVIEESVCKLYGSKNQSDVNAVRYQKVIDSQSKCGGPKRGLDPSNLPPCRATLKQKVRRSNFVAYSWKHAHQQIPTLADPENHGWAKRGSVYEIVWYKCPQLPQDFSASAYLTDSDDETDDDVRYTLADSDTDDSTDEDDC